MEPKKKRKVLILSCNTGEGHNTAARAIRERCEAEGHEAVVLDFLSLSGNRVSSFISNFYINMAKYVPHVFGFFYNSMLLVSRSFYIGHSIVYLCNARVAPKLKAYLDENEYDAIVMTHMFAADAIAKLRSKGQQTPLSGPLSGQIRQLPAPESGPLYPAEWCPTRQAKGVIYAWSACGK